MSNEINDIAIKVSEENRWDIVYYSGEISRDGYELISGLCSQKKDNDGLALILTTYGGDAHAAYRIARALRHSYKSLHVFIPGECKSAGTLITIGGTELIVSDKGELGPLDIQLVKPDELFESNSGLDVMQALSVMQTQAIELFRACLMDIKLGSGITFKSAAEIATKVTSGLFSPVYAHVDPIKLGEISRAISIANAYGQRLRLYDDIISSESLENLISAYPSHSFVIDRKEARDLFRNVRAPNMQESSLVDALYKMRPPTYTGTPYVINVLKLIEEVFDERINSSDQQAVDQIKGGQGDAEQDYDCNSRGE
jgi:hypothetical protein